MNGKDFVGAKTVNPFDITKALDRVEDVMHKEPEELVKQCRTCTELQDCILMDSKMPDDGNCPYYSILHEPQKPVCETCGGSGEIRVNVPPHSHRYDPCPDCRKEVSDE